MGYLIGTDEAGYGPNFGPLIVSATVWRVEGSPDGVDLYKRLGAAVTKEPCERSTPSAAEDGQAAARSAAGTRLRIADSKVVYRAGQGLAELELGVQATLGCSGTPPRGWQALWPMLTGLAAPGAAADPCCADFDCQLPLAAAAADIERAALALGAALRAARVCLVAIFSRAVFPREFNDLVAEHGGKGGALSHVTIALVAAAFECLRSQGLPLEPAWIVCDKHGGRNRYSPLLQQQFPDTLIEVRGESLARSVYRWRHGGQAMEAHFCARGEEHLPVALASMVSKYLREVAMLAFNRFWRERLPDLRPTAGYPGDSRRFRRDIAQAQRELGLADALVWRAK